MTTPKKTTIICRLCERAALPTLRASLLEMSNCRMRKVWSSVVLGVWRLREDWGTDVLIAGEIKSNPSLSRAIGQSSTI